MTKREAAIVSAYTGYLIGSFSDFHAYAEEIFGRPIFTHEFPSIVEELKEKSKKDFMSIKVTEKEEPPEWLYQCDIPFEKYSLVDFYAVEKALGFRLFGWQKDYIVTGRAYAGRRTGKTTAEILHQLLSVDEEPIDFSKPAPIKRIAIVRQYYRDIWEKLQDAGIEIRPVFWSIEDRKKYYADHYDPYKYVRTCLDEYDKGEQSNPPEFLAKCMNIRVPDCNNCRYLNFTEKEQQVYGINSYKKDHRCKCYDRPVYHQTNSFRHDPYIYPCEECREDNFVNYYDCESSKKGE